MSGDAPGGAWLGALAATLDDPVASQAAFAWMLHVQRRQARLSRMRLADLCLLDRSTISRLEVGDRHPSRPVAIRLADALGLAGLSRLRFLALAGYVDGAALRALAVDAAAEAA